MSKIGLLLILLSVLVACGAIEGKTDDLAYEDIVDLATEKFESDLPEFGDSDYDFYDIDYGNDLRANSDITIWDGEYVKLVVYDQSEDSTRTTYYKLENAGITNVNDHPDIDFDSLEQKEPDYIEEQGEIVKER